MIDFKILPEKMDVKTALSTAGKDMLTNAEMDWLIQNRYNEIKKCLPAWTATHISYKAGAREALIWNEGEKKKTKINLPLYDGWYLPDKKYGIPNGKASDSGNPKARYLWRWQDQDYDGLLLRWLDWDGDRRDVDAYYWPGGRYGVAIRSTSANKTSDKTDYKSKYEELLGKVKEAKMLLNGVE